MRAVAQRSGQRGQAAVEGLLALTLLGALWYGVTAVGTVSMYGQQASHHSRLAAFTGVEQDTLIHNGVVLDVFVDRGPLHKGMPIPAAEERCDEKNDQFGTKVCIGDTHAVHLQRDWLPDGSRIRRSHATAHLLAPPTLIKRDEALSRLSISRHTAIAPTTGYENDDAVVALRIANSTEGWRNAGDLSRLAAQKVIDTMKDVDKAVTRGSASTNWVSAWSALPLRK